MVRFFFVLFNFFFVLNSFAQINVVDVAKPISIGKVGNIAATFIYMDKEDSVYTITYQDIKFQHLTEFKSFSFKDINNDFDKLYKIIIDGLDNPPKEDIMLELPNDIVWLHFQKSLGVVNVRFSSAVNKNPNIIGVSIYMTKKQVLKLFGKG